MSVNEEIREQRKKLKGQGFKAHLEYFWEYYKIHTFVAIAVIIFVVTIVRDISNNKPYALYALCINSEGMDSQDILQDGFIEYYGIDTEKEAVLVDTTANFLSSTVDTSAVATGEKVMALISAKNLDVMIADETSFTHFGGQDTFLDLRNVFSEKELSDISDIIFYMDQSYIDYLSSPEYSDYITTGKYDENNKYARMAAEYNETFVHPSQEYSDMENPVPVGIMLEDSKMVAESGLYTTVTPIAGIVVNSQKIEASKAFIEYMAQTN